MVFGWFQKSKNVCPILVKIVPLVMSLSTATHALVLMASQEHFVMQVNIICVVRLSSFRSKIHVDKCFFFFSTYDRFRN